TNTHSLNTNRNKLTNNHLSIWSDSCTIFFDSAAQLLNRNNAMIKNYFKTTLRYLWRNRLFTGLNIFGLAIGISACWIIYRMVDYEFSFDKQQPNAERVFQVVSQSRDQHGRGGGFSAIAKALPPALADGMTGVELVVPIYQQSRETAHVAT